MGSVLGWPGGVTSSELSSLVFINLVVRSIYPLQLTVYPNIVRSVCSRWRLPPGPKPVCHTLFVLIYMLRAPGIPATSSPHSSTIPATSPPPTTISATSPHSTTSFATSPSPTTIPATSPHSTTISATSPAIIHPSCPTNHCCSLTCHWAPEQV